ncbi:MAG: hypothetical protein ACOX3I_04355 [Limnochordia bacterium]
MGYPRAAALRGSQVLTAYDFNTHEPQKAYGGTRFTAATVFSIPD